MRKYLLLTLISSLSFVGFSGSADATSVDLIFISANVSGGAISGLGTNSVTLDPGATATLTLDIQVKADAEGLIGIFMSLEI